MALQNWVGLGRETFSFQFHFEKSQIGPKCRIADIFNIFFQKLPDNFGVKYGWSGRLIGNKGIFA